MAEATKQHAILVGPEAEAAWFGSLCREQGLEAHRFGAEEAIAWLAGAASRTALLVFVGTIGEALSAFRASLPEAAGRIPFVVSGALPEADEAQLVIRLKISAWVPTGGVPKPLLFQEIAKRVAEIREEEELRQGFLTDAEGLVEEMEGLVLSFEAGAADSTAFARLYACAHTIKGASGFFQPDLVHRYTHRFEDYLSSIKPRLPAISGAEISTILSGIDQMKGLLREFAAGALHARGLPELSKLFEGKAAAAGAEASAASSAPGAAPAKDGAKPAAPTNGAPEELRVRLSLINEFIEQSGEITVIRNMLDSTFRQIETSRGNDPEINLLSKLLLELHKNVSNMQDKLGELKKVPFGKVVRPLERTVKDLATTLGKDVTFAVEGSEHRIDSSVADLLSRCLIHLVRNSLDHGLEKSEARTAAGKPAGGTLSLRCVPSSDYVKVRLADDGRGIDPVMVRKKAVEKGILSEKEAAALHDADAQALIFAPGFSTAAEVSDVSGRGVGTDMVKGSVLAAGGKLLLDSNPGKGTSFELWLPVPKAVNIVDCLLVRLRGETFAIPHEGVERIIAADTPAFGERYVSAGGAPFWREDDSLVPILDGPGLLNLPAASEEAATTAGFLVLLRTRHGLFGFRADEVMDSAESVVKRLEAGLGQNPCYLGATFLSDARVALVLSAEGLAAKAGLKERAASALRSEATAAGAARWLLFRAGGGRKFAMREAEILRADLREGREPIIISGHSTFRLGSELAQEISFGPSAGEFLLFCRVRGRALSILVEEFLEFAEISDADQQDGVTLAWEYGRVVSVGEQIVHLLDTSLLPLKSA